MFHTLQFDQLPGPRKKVWFYAYTKYDIAWGQLSSLSFVIARFRLFVWLPIIIGLLGAGQGYESLASGELLLLGITIG